MSRISEIPGLKQLQRRIRRKRCQMFLDKMRPDPGTRILDVGGNPMIWMMPEMLPFKATLLNIVLTRIPDGMEDRLEGMEGDARSLDCEDGAHPLLFSNSVIEHLHTFENQKKMADEIRRVSDAYWVQTPAYACFFEPHLMAPFFHWFPVGFRKRIARWFTPWGLLKKPSPEIVSELVDELRILRHREMEELFPDAEIHVERFLGMPKSYIAIRRSGA